MRTDNIHIAVPQSFGKPHHHYKLNAEPLLNAVNVLRSQQFDLRSESIIFQIKQSEQ